MVSYNCRHSKSIAKEKSYNEFLAAVCEVGIQSDVYTVLESLEMVQICLIKLNAVELSEPVDVLISTSSPFNPNKDSAIGN